MSSSTALVLAGGGSLGAVQVGMLQALVEAGVRVDLVVGSSVGAINGAYFAARPNLDGVAELAAVWLVKTPDGKTHIDNSRTIQRATYAEVNAIMATIIDDIKAEIGELATFVSYRLTCHGGTKKHRKGGKRR